MLPRVHSLTADTDRLRMHWAGSGGGTGSPEFTQRLADGDRSTESPASPRNVMNASYWALNHREPAEREEMLLSEILKSRTGDDGYPGAAERWCSLFFEFLDSAG